MTIHADEIVEHQRLVIVGQHVPGFFAPVLAHRIIDLRQPQRERRIDDDIDFAQQVATASPLNAVEDLVQFEQQFLRAARLNAGMMVTPLFSNVRQRMFSSRAQRSSRPSCRRSP